jgi:hypothetical protein
MHLKTQYCLNSSWLGHKAVTVAFHGNYGEDSFHERLLPQVSKPPKDLLIVRICNPIIKEEKHTQAPKPEPNNNKMLFC